MPRQARQLSPTGIYHIMLRGINRQRIFEDVSDYSYFLECLRRVHNDCGVTVLAYCCMPNHIHLLLEESDEPISFPMKSLGIRYATWFNRKYDRVGHLFQDRFLSKPVVDDAYFQTVVMYIHFNPVVAGICTSPLDYRWSSRRMLEHSSSLVDLTRLNEIYPLDSLRANERMYEPSQHEDQPLLGRPCHADDCAWTLLCHTAGVSTGSEFQDLSRHKQQAAIQLLRAHRFPIRQISRLTGLSRYLIEKWDGQ